MPSGSYEAEASKLGVTESGAPTRNTNTGRGDVVLSVDATNFPFSPSSKAPAGGRRTATGGCWKNSAYWPAWQTFTVKRKS